MLPSEYTIRMKALLGDEYDDYLKSLEGPMIKALRLNPVKADEAQLLGLCRNAFGDVFERVPWEPSGYYYPVDESIRPGSHPLHEAGAYYIQEPSAMKPVTLLDVRPGQRVLDLCAAPGGKSTQIGGYLKGEGLLVCSEPVGKRAKILSRNIERMGIGNALVLNELPGKLSDIFPGFFDRILVDAPCSGEGMFRKNEEEALREWSPQNVEMCAERQAEILESAAGMLAPGGIMVYSTCTFSHEEDEGCIEGFLAKHPEFILISREKLFPHKIRGEGHFMAKLKKEGEGANRLPSNRPVKGKDECIDAFRSFADQMFCGDNMGLFDLENIGKRLTLFGDNLYLLPEGIPPLKGLKVERPGLHLGTVKRDTRKSLRFEPAHALALALRPGEVKNSVNITQKEAGAYIRGMTLNISDSIGLHNTNKYRNGWILVCLEGLSLGWGKLVNGVVKNHYPKGLRVMG